MIAFRRNLVRFRRNAHAFKKYCGKDPCQAFNDWAKNALKDGGYEKLLECMAKAGFGSPADRNRIHHLLRFIEAECLDHDKTDEPTICAYEEDMNTVGGDAWPKECGKPCNRSWVEAETYNTVGAIETVPPKGESLCESNPSDACSQALRRLGCRCVIAICSESKGGDRQAFCDSGFYHEMTHCAGYLGSPTHSTPRRGDPNDFVYRIGCCLCKRITPNGRCGEC